MLKKKKYKKTNNQYWIQFFKKKTKFWKKLKNIAKIAHLKDENIYKLFACLKNNNDNKTMKLKEKMTQY